MILKTLEKRDIVFHSKNLRTKYSYKYFTILPIIKVLFFRQDK